MRILFLACLALLCATPTFATTTYYYGFDDQLAIDVSDDQLILQFNASVSESAALAEIASLPGTTLTQNIRARWFVVTCSDKAQVYAILLNNALVLYVSDTYSRPASSSVGQPLALLPSNDVLLQFKPGVTANQKSLLLGGYNLSLAKSTQAYQKFAVPKGQSPLAVANALQESGLCVFAHPDFIVKPIFYSDPPTDPYYPQQWNFNNTGQTTINGFQATPDADIDMPEAWNLTKGSDAIVVAVIDNGLSANHPDLPASRQIRLPGSNIPAQFDASLNPNDPSPMSNLDAHGPACAGLIGASHNSSGIAGIAPNTMIMPIRIDVVALPESALVDAILLAYNNQADIISISWGFGIANPNFIPAMVTAIELATTSGRNGLGCVFSIASGNNATHTNQPLGGFGYGFVAFPACVLVEGVLTVGASNRWDEVADYSGFGNISNSHQRIDLVAPSSHSGALSTLQGVTFGLPGEAGEIYTMDIPGNAGCNPYTIDHLQDIDMPYHPPLLEEAPNTGPDYLAYSARFSGTSASAPQVAGVAALLLSESPCLTQLEVFDFLTESADQISTYDYSWDVAALGRSWEVGHGRLNAHQALLLLHSSFGPTIEINPTIAQGQTIWNLDRTVTGTVRIPNGAELRIESSTISFTNRAQIVVEQGGKLIVTNSTLTSSSAPDLCGTTGLWEGIQVWGTANQPQSFSGRATVWYAYKATV